MSAPGENAGNPDGNASCPSRREIPPSDLLPPRREGRYHGAVAGPEQREIARFLDADGEFLGWRAFIRERKSVVDSTYSAWLATHVRFDEERDQAVRPNRSFNERFVEPALLAAHVEKDRRLAEFDREAETLSSARDDAHLEAAEAAASVLLDYDPADPRRLLGSAVAVRSERAVYADMSLTAPRRGHAFTTRIGYGAAKCVAGAVLGACYLGTVGLVRVSSIHREPGALVLVAIFVGVSAVYLASYGIEAAYARLRESEEMGEPEERVRRRTAVARMTVAAAVVIDTVVDAKGLMARQELLASMPGHHGGPSPVWMVFVGAAVSYAYGLYAASHGYEVPNFSAANRVALARENEARDLRSQAREDGEVKAAAIAAARAAVLDHQAAALPERRARIVREFEAKIAAIEERRRSEDPTLPGGHHRILRQILEELRGRTKEYYALVEAYLNRTEGRLRLRWWWPFRWPR